MAKPEWGTKRVCASCGARFYDLGRDPVVCPACGTAYDPVVHTRASRRPRAAAPAPKIVPVVGEEEEVEVETPASEEEEVEAEAEDEVTVAASVVAEDEDAEEAEEEEEEEEADNAIEDVSELGDDDMSDVIDTEIDEETTER